MAEVAREIIGEFFRLRESEDGVTSKTDAQCENFAIRYTFAPIWTYQVPIDQELVLLPEHRFGAHIEDDEAAPAEWTDNQFVRVEVWDATLRRMIIPFQARYVHSKELQDTELMARLELSEPLRLKAGDWIYIAGYCPHALYTIDVSDSYFSLEMLRVRPSLYKG